MASQQAEYRAKVEAAKEEEERLQDACTSLELRKAMAVEQSLQDRLAHVDELLESLQEEEWQDEEEAEVEEAENIGTLQSSSEARGSAQKITQRAASELSLLDEILAMVLGATTAPLSVPDPVAWLAQEHRTIVSDWKAFFGRLPPSLLLSQSKDAAYPDFDEGNCDILALPSQTQIVQKDGNYPEDPATRQRALRNAFGIEDKDVDNWEDVVDDEEERAAFNLKQPMTATTVGNNGQPQQREANKPRVGLRPGGRLQR